MYTTILIACISAVVAVVVYALVTNFVVKNSIRKRREAALKEAEAEAERLLERASAEFQDKQYAKALLTIDSLRHAYPDAIDARKQALKLYQDISLKQAQDDLARTDSALQAVKARYAVLKDSVEKKRASLTATEAELSELNLTRVKRDSLQVRFDTQCAKIKYIHRKQKEE